jgi:hypothetical protein
MIKETQLSPIKQHKKDMKNITYGLSTAAVVLVCIIIYFISK